jgi:hypothetical protein
MQELVIKNIILIHAKSQKANLRDLSHFSIIEVVRNFFGGETMQSQGSSSEAITSNFANFLFSMFADQDYLEIIILTQNIKPAFRLDMDYTIRGIDLINFAAKSSGEISCATAGNGRALTVMKNCERLITNLFEFKQITPATVKGLKMSLKLLMKDLRQLVPLTAKNAPETGVAIASLGSIITKNENSEVTNNFYEIRTCFMRLEMWYNVLRGLTNAENGSPTTIQPPLWQEDIAPPKNVYQLSKLTESIISDFTNNTSDHEKFKEALKTNFLKLYVDLNSKTRLTFLDTYLGSLNQALESKIVQSSENNKLPTNKKGDKASVRFITQLLTICCECLALEISHLNDKDLAIKISKNFSWFIFLVCQKYQRGVEPGLAESQHDFSSVEGLMELESHSNIMERTLD